MNKWVSDSFPCPRDSFPSVRLPCLASIRWFCFILSYIWLSSLRSLFFSNERQKVSGCGGKGTWWGTGRSRGRGTCNQDRLYEKRTYFQWKGGKRLAVPRVGHLRSIQVISLITTCSRKSPPHSWVWILGLQLMMLSGKIMELVGALLEEVG